LAAHFWEHAICKEGDYERHVDYLNYNLGKHGHVTREADWPYSSFHQYVEPIFYNLEWAADDDVQRLEVE
jgi:putative transposase